jgi:hydrogenase expression/formation protein HypE
LDHLEGLIQHVHVLKDPTRGGLATALNEIAESSGVAIWVEEGEIPIRPEVRQVSELLGLDPLYLANEGKLIAIVERSWTGEILKRMKGHPLGMDASIIGEVREEPQGKVLIRTRIGGTRILPMLKGSQLPRIC